MRILIDDGMQISVGTGIGKYSMYLYRALREHLEKEIETVDIAQYKRNADSKMLGRLKAIPHKSAARQAMPFPPAAPANLLTYAQ